MVGREKICTPARISACGGDIFCAKITVRTTQNTGGSSWALLEAAPQVPRQEIPGALPFQVVDMSLGFVSEVFKGKISIIVSCS